MSARSRRKIFQTYLCGDGRPGPGRRRAGLGCCRPVLARGAPSRSSRSALLTTRSAFSKEQQRMRGGYTRLGVTRDRVETPRGGRGTGRKRRTLLDHALSPFGRLSAARKAACCLRALTTHPIVLNVPSHNTTRVRDTVNLSRRRVG